MPQAGAEDRTLNRTSHLLARGRTFVHLSRPSRFNQRKPWICHAAAPVSRPSASWFASSTADLFPKEAVELHGILRVKTSGTRQVGSSSVSISVPSASAFESRGIGLRNSKLSRISCTFGEKPSR